MNPHGPMALEQFNAADEGTIRASLQACLDVATWVELIASRRPYADAAELSKALDDADDTVTWDQVAAALARHPRIGQKATGATREASWSASEQSGVEQTQEEAFASGNATYEARFGHIFLICAAGLSGAEMLDALRRRMDNDAVQEQPVVIGELKKIARLRLQKVVQA